MKSGDLNPLVSKVYSRVKGLVSLPDLLLHSPSGHYETGLIARTYVTKMAGGTKYYLILFEHEQEQNLSWTLILSKPLETANV